MSIFSRVNDPLTKSLFKEFAGNEDEKILVAQWLDQGVNIDRVKWAMEDNRDPGTEKATKLAVTVGLLGMCFITSPVAIAVGATIALLGEGVRFLEETSVAGKAYKDLEFGMKLDIETMQERNTKTEKENVTSMKSSPTKYKP